MQQQKLILQTSTLLKLCFHKQVLYFLLYHFFLYFLGTDVTIVAHSLGVQKAIEGAEELAKQGINCEVSLNNYSGLRIQLGNWHFQMTFSSA